jgi:hypothetical protein
MKQLRFGTVRLSYQREIPTQSLIPLIDDLSEEFLTVETSRQNLRIAASGLSPDVGVILTVGAGALAVTYLSELGKDLYQGTRALFFRIYDSIKLGITASGRVWPFGIDVGLEGDHPSILFMFDEGLSEQEFQEGLALIPAALGELAEFANPPEDNPLKTVARYDPRLKRWSIQR